MAQVVWKYPLRPWSIFLDIPAGARVLSCGAQGNEVVVWVLCDEDAPRVSRILAGHPTGTPLPPALRRATFVGTAQMDDGLVFHVFDGGENEGDGSAVWTDKAASEAEPAAASSSHGKRKPPFPRTRG